MESTSEEPPACPVCGSPLQQWECEPDDPEEAPWDIATHHLTGWWGDIVLLCDPEEEFEQLLPKLSLDVIAGRKSSLAAPYATSLRQLKPRTEDIRSYRGSWDHKTYFSRTEQDGKHVRVLVGQTDDLEAIPEKTLHIPMHASCFELAERMFRSASSSPLGRITRNSYIKDIRGLFMALRWRAAMYGRAAMLWTWAGNQKGLPPNYDMRTEGYYSPPFDIYEQEDPLNDAWPGNGKNSDENRRNLFAVSPLNIQELTQTLLRNLKEIPANTIDETQASKFGDRFFSLPAELRMSIIEHMCPIRDLPRITTGLLPQSWWRDLLIQGELLPWLWDLDGDVILANDQESRPSNTDGTKSKWNWELLFRQLSRGIRFGIRADAPKGLPTKDDWFNDFLEEIGMELDYDADNMWVSTGYYDDLDHVPPGLHHRRRVWQLLEEMFVGDVVNNCDVDSTEARNEAKRLWTFWDKSGNLLPNGPRAVPPVNLSGYQKKINGEVYIEHGMWPNQHWQEIPPLPLAAPHPPGGREMQRALGGYGYPVEVYDGPREDIGCRMSRYPRDEYCPICSDNLAA